jgi:hypothetical protein
MAQRLRRDYYLTDRQRLEGQPKRTIADYVEQNGILVPRRFANFREAKRAAETGIKVFARSEHAQEYDGVSGLLDSCKLDPRTVDNERQMLGLITRETLFHEEKFKSAAEFLDFLRIYCKFLGISIGKFRKEISASYWEHIDGYNLAVVADSAIAGRYHVVTNNKKGRRDDVIVDGGSTTFLGYSEWLKTGNPLKELTRIIELYEEIRHLSRFDPNHCPIMEFVTVDGKDYFLQYHRTRDFEPATFELSRAVQADEFEAQLARGATQSIDGETIQTLIAPTKVITLRAQLYDATKGMMSGSAQASAFHPIIADLLARTTHFQTIRCEEPTYESAVDAFNHMKRSLFFKPKISVICEDELVGLEERIKLRRRARETGQDQYVTVHVVSDGRRALLSRVD